MAAAGGAARLAQGVPGQGAPGVGAADRADVILAPDRDVDWAEVPGARTILYGELTDQSEGGRRRIDDQPGFCAKSRNSTAEGEGKRERRKGVVRCITVSKCWSGGRARSVGTT